MHRCVKQLAIFERSVVAASDFKNCIMVNCDLYASLSLIENTCTCIITKIINIFTVWLLADNSK